ncbi:hypothetical protein Sjap_008736 [Stephania japonica]|uniref:Uncharacterized protein n=1 Tax=Stephania japonica TaxID=461633 RepID=A0AAP0PBM7_9MAGN
MDGTIGEMNSLMLGVLVGSVTWFITPIAFKVHRFGIRDEGCEVDGLYVSMIRVEGPLALSVIVTPTHRPLIPLDEENERKRTTKKKRKDKHKPLMSDVKFTLY